MPNMHLVEQHIIKVHEARFNELAKLCHLSKNLYNAALYHVRQHFFRTGQLLNYLSLNRLFVRTRQPDYYALPAKVAQQTLLMVEQNFKSFLALRAVAPEQARPPQYLDKAARFQLIYTAQAISQVALRQGIIHLSQTSVRTPTHRTRVAQVRVIPRGNHCCVEVVYLRDEPELQTHNGRYAALDLGLNNLACVTSNVVKPIIINGKPLKSVNQFFHKRRAQLHSKLINGRQTSRRLRALTHKRNCKIKDYLHKASRSIINHLVSNQITVLVVGKNDGWKQEIKLGRRNNQNFVAIPHSRLVQLLEYKARLAGLTVIQQEESYTSACSFLDHEEIGPHEQYSGRRIKRGLFRSRQGYLINADVNGSLNILRKAVPNITFDNGIEVSSAPLVITIK